MNFEKPDRKFYVDRVNEIKAKQLDRSVVILQLLEAGFTIGSAKSTATYLYGFVSHPETFNRFATNIISLSQARKEMAIGGKGGRPAEKPEDVLARKLLDAARYGFRNSIPLSVFEALARAVWRRAAEGDLDTD
jgi:hypothetical protein